LPWLGPIDSGRFNLDTEQTTYFKGVPIPMIGILTACFPLLYWQAQMPLVSKLLLSPIFWYVYILLVSYLMVMKTPMLALKSLSGKKNLLLPLVLVGLETAVSAVFL
jgi:CDP-diacylglycerol--serine O-phosphatidyltransferase